MEAVSLFHAAREVWPERNEFGSENMSVEEELNALQEIFMANLHSKFCSIKKMLLVSVSPFY